MSDAERSHASGSSALDELVFEYLELVEQGGPADLDALCGAHPELASELRARISALQHAGLLASAGAAQEEQMPEQLGEFRVLRRIGGGGMGVVFLAEQRSLGRVVALKVIRPEQAYFPGARERFQREVEAVAKLAHPGIVPVYTVGADRGVPYYAMEHVDGVPLSRAIEALAGRAPDSLSGRDLQRVVDGASSTPADPAARVFAATWVTACLELARQVANALQHAHERGVLHRDVKPSNVMLTPAGEARLVDFGLATREGSQRLTRTGAQLGSLAYTPPEQARGAADAPNHAWDVYSLGVTLYELLTLRLPFASASATTLLQLIADGRAESPRRANPAVSLDVETVCATAMELDPARRYASMRDFANDLTCVLELRPIAARRASGWLRTQRWIQRNPSRAVALALGVLLVAGGPIAYALVERDARRDVERANDELSRTNTALAAAKNETEQALTRAEAQRVRAQNNFERSLRTVETMLTDVGADDLENVPLVQQARERLFDKALGFYGELLAENPGDFKVRQELARTGRAKADFLLSLGRRAEAEELYREQIARFAELIRENPSELDHRHSHASCRGQLGALWMFTERGDEARVEIEGARDELDALTKEPGARPGFLRDLTVVYDNLAQLNEVQGRAEEALRCAERETQCAARLLELDPTSVDYRDTAANAAQRRGSMLGDLGRIDEARVDLARAFELKDALVREGPASRDRSRVFVEICGNYGLMLGQLGEADEAERVLRRGRDVALELVRDFPDEPRNVMNLAGVAINLGAQIGPRGKLTEAAEAFDSTVAPLEKLASAHPELLEAHFYLATALQNVAGVELELLKSEQALATAERSLAAFERALAAAPAHTGITNQRAFTLCVKAEALAQLGRIDEAQRTLAEATSIAIERSDLFIAQAEAFAQLAKFAPAESSSVHLDSAFASVRKGLAAGFGDLAYLRTSPKLARVRERADFEPLLAEFTAAKQ